MIYYLSQAAESSILTLFKNRAKKGLLANSTKTKIQGARYVMIINEYLFWVELVGVTSYKLTLTKITSKKMINEHLKQNIFKGVEDRNIEMLLHF